MPTRLTESELSLREIVPGDTSRLYDWRMDPANQPMFRTTASVPFATHAQFIARYFDPGNHDAWFIIEVEGEPVGMIALYELDFEKCEGTWGRFVIDALYRGRRYGRRALQLLTDYARELGLRRLRCEVLDSNTIAEKLYLSVGFVEIGDQEVEGRRFKELAVSLEGNSR